MSLFKLCWIPLGYHSYMYLQPGGFFLPLPITGTSLWKQAVSEAETKSVMMDFLSPVFEYELYEYDV